MSDHWRLALRHAVWISVAALTISAVVFLVYGGSSTWGFLYGAGGAVLSFLSTALTVSMFAGKSMAAGLMIGVGSFILRLVFATIVLGVPAYLSLWPVVPMLIGFAGVYVAENVLATLTVMKSKEWTQREARSDGS